jgi:hypothetical protein
MGVNGVVRSLVGVLTVAVGGVAAYKVSCSTSRKSENGY